MFDGKFGKHLLMTVLYSGTAHHSVC